MQASKRVASEAGLKSNNGPDTKTVKRRASQACQSCRARKIRCNVARDGPPCIHCKLDEIECVVGQSKRNTKKILNVPSAASNGNVPPSSNDTVLSTSGSYQPLQTVNEDVPLQLDQTTLFTTTPTAPSTIFYDFQQPGQQPQGLSEGTALSHNLASPSTWPSPVLPAYIKPLPSRFGQDDITYLQAKGALAIPDQDLRNALLRSYAEYAYPFMPLLDLHQFARVIDRNDGVNSISLLLFQAVMFAGVATVDKNPLTAAGYHSRREARRAFFNKTRLLYDLDYEDDSIALIQSLLLMTYWREDPSARKETHHWLAIALSQVQKIGLHRNPNESAALENWQKMLRKRIWWSAYIRDCQIALGTRRSTLMKDIDFDVPMLQLHDFDMETLPQAPCCIPPDCQVVRDPEKQRQLAVMAIEMAKLSMCISHTLSVRYGATSSRGSSRTAAMLLTDHLAAAGDEVQACFGALRSWKDRLPDVAQYVTPTQHDVDSNGSCLVLNRAYLHMAFYAALASLHRSLLVPSPAMIPRTATSNELEESRRAVRFAATKITIIASTLYNLDLVRYLPSPTITFLLPAIVVHLHDVLAVDKSLPIKSMQDFCKCMQIMGGLREIYAAADYSTAFLQTAIQKTEIGPVTPPTEEDRNRGNVIPGMQSSSDRRLQGQPAGPDAESSQFPQGMGQRNVDHAPGPNGLGNNGIALEGARNSFLTSADVATDQEFNHMQQVNQLSQYSSQNLGFNMMNAANDVSPMNATTSNNSTIPGRIHDFEIELDNARNVGMASPVFDVGDSGAFDPAVQNESNAFPLETDWLMGIGNDGLMLVGEEGEPSML